MSDRLVYLNGSILPADEAKVSVFDRGLLYGDGLFETIRIQGGTCLRLEKHLARLVAGAGMLGFGDTLDGLDLAGAIGETVEANGLADARVRLTVTRGPISGPGRLAPEPAEPTVIITADPLPTHPPRPARVIISSIRRDEQNPLSSVKSLNYLPGVLAAIEARRAGADDAILLNTQGLVAEGTVDNLFLVTGGALVTPSLDQGPLPGTVRAAVIELAPRLGLEVVERAVEMKELAGTEELFFTNAIQLVRPIREIAGAIIGSGDYPISRRIRQALADSE